MTEPLATRVAASLDRDVAPEVREIAATLARENDALAVLFYGSNLRTGSLEGVLDFYVLLPGPQVDRIWPRVSYREWPREEGEPLRAKIAAMSLAKFAEAASGKSLDTTIWARFVQPCALVRANGHNAREPVVGAIAAATQTAAQLAAATGPESGGEEDFWLALFRSTYAAEFRFETVERARSILELNPAHFNGLLVPALAASGIDCTVEGERIAPMLGEQQRKSILGWWEKRRRLGKALNLTRLVKASTTFEGAARYAAWKIERHTGVPVEVTPFRERHPILAAPGVLLSVWRKRRAG